MLALVELLSGKFYKDQNIFPSQNENQIILFQMKQGLRYYVVSGTPRGVSVDGDLLKFTQIFLKSL